MFARKTILEQWGPIDANILYPSVWIIPSSGAFKHRWQGISWSEMYGIFRGGKTTLYWDKIELEKQGTKIINKYFLRDKAFKRLKVQYDDYLAEIKFCSRQVEDLSKNQNPSISKVRKLGKQWYDLLLKFWDLTLIFEIANYTAPAYLRINLAGLAPEEELNYILEKLLAPEKLSFHQQSELELLKIKRDSNKGNLDRLLEKYTGKWYWVENSYGESKHLTARYFKNKIRNITKVEASKLINRIINYPSKVKSEKNKIYKKYNIPVPGRKIVQVLAHSIWWQDHRKAVAWWSEHVTDCFSQYMAERKEIALTDVALYTFPEWKNLVVNDRKIPSAVIKKRKVLTVIRMHGGWPKIYTGKQANHLVKQINKLVSSKSHAKELAGVAVGTSKKKITGIVRILHSSREADKMKTGEILIAPMTSPDYIVAMRKAKAIITDIGGLMSHAAVLARELDIPCVVGTKNATKYFRDGDKAEIDLSKGMVNKIS